MGTFYKGVEKMYLEIYETYKTFLTLSVRNPKSLGIQVLTKNGREICHYITFSC